MDFMQITLITLVAVLLIGWLANISNRLFYGVAVIGLMIALGFGIQGGSF